MELVSWAADHSRSLLAPLGSRCAHFEAVALRAREIAVAVSADDRELLVAAAYLHDVGYAPELVVHGFHPLDGAVWLRQQGLERRAGLVAYHTGARFQAEAHGLADRIAAFRDEASAVSAALAYSDLTTGPGENASPRPNALLRSSVDTVRRVSSCARANASDTLAAMVGRTEQRLAERRQALAVMALT